MGSIKTIKQHAIERRRKKISFKNAQDIIPITRFCGKGMFVSDKTYIKTWNFSNANFKLLGREQESAVLKRWCEVLNGFEPGATYKYTVMKRTVDIEEYKNKRLFKYENDGFDHLRKEYNDMLLDKIADTKLIEEERIFQAAISKQSEDEARSFFNRSEPHLEGFFRTVGSEFAPLVDEEYLKILWRFLHMDSGEYCDQLDFKEIIKNKRSIKDFLAPYQFETDSVNNCIKMGGKYFRAMYVPPSSYAKYIKDSVLSELASLDKNMCISVDIIPIQMNEAYAMIEDLEFNSERNIQKFKGRQARAGNSDADPPFNMRKKAQQIEEYNFDINERDQRIMLGNITLIHSAATIEELDADSEILKTKARQQGCELVALTMEQEDGFISAMPFGINRFIGKYAARFRTFTTEGLASFIPFTVQEFSETDGIYYGQNKLSRNPIFINRKKGMNGNIVILGSSGSGKSFKKKEEVLHILLNTKDKVVIIDPEREYRHLIDSLGGVIIKMSADSTDHINAMEISENYNDGMDPITLKSEAILTFYAMAKNAETIDSGAKSVIDRCVRNVLKKYVKNSYEGEVPTLVDLRDELLKQQEPIAKEIALTLELYTTGSLNLFSKPTNVNMDNRLICFDISDLGDNLMPIAMLIITDFINNTLSKNRNDEVYTWIDIDELYLMFMQEYTAGFFYKLWKRVRKYGGLCTGITQEIADLLKSDTAKTLLTNSYFLILMSTDETDSLLIKDLLKLDDVQMAHITDVGQKNGMIKIGKSYIPFTDSFSADTELYKIMSTKFKEST